MFNMQQMIRVVRCVLGVVAIIAVTRKYFVDDLTLGNYLSTFTFESNLFAGLVLLGTALLSPASVRTVFWDRLRGASVMYLLTTFIVYGLLINGFDNPFNTDRHWTHTVVHQLMPILMVIDLLIQPFAHRLSWRTVVLWMVYPIVFVIYSLIRGGLMGWYPYSFINPEEAGGWIAVSLYVLGITVGFAMLATLLMLLSQRYHARDEIAIATA